MSMVPVFAAWTSPLAGELALSVYGTDARGRGIGHVYPTSGIRDENLLGWGGAGGGPGGGLAIGGTSVLLGRINLAPSPPSSFSEKHLVSVHPRAVFLDMTVSSRPALGAASV